MRRCGIYLIKCEPAGVRPRYYVGQSVDMLARRRAHFNFLRSGRHHNIFLQRAFSKHGAPAFSFEILEDCDPLELNDREGWWLREMVGSSACFNMSTDPASPHRGRRLSDEHRARISRGGKGLRRCDRTRAAIAGAVTGEKNPMFGVTGERHPRSRGVIATCQETGVERVYESACSAEADGFSQAAISRCCSGKQAKHMGMSWRFIPSSSL